MVLDVPFSERSPLLSRESFSTKTKRRSRPETASHTTNQQYQHHSQNSAQNDDGHTGKYSRNNARRFLLNNVFLTRFRSVLSQNVQTASLRMMPPLDTETHYEDTHNDESWLCSFGTREDDGIWINYKDRVGTLMAMIVWCLVIYSAFTVLLLAQHYHCSILIATIHVTICTLALACHLKTTFTDPGAVPSGALPLQHHAENAPFHIMCSICSSFKPNCVHHCRICNRCISRMDHHCPWMNNCIGAGNMKHFILFLVYTWLGAAVSLIVFGMNYFYCPVTHEACGSFTTLEVLLVRVMTVVCIGALLFTTSMLSSVAYGILTGIGTIDRLRRKSTNTYETVEEPIPLTNIFGVGSYLLWILPTDPDFDDYDRVMGYSTRQRLLREDMLYKDAERNGA